MERELRQGGFRRFSDFLRTIDLTIDYIGTSMSQNWRCFTPRFSLRTLLICVLTIGTLATLWWHYEPWIRVRAISNSDVTWDGNTLGLQAQMSDRAKKVLSLERRAVPALLHAVQNDDQVVAAHVLLSHIAGESFQFSSREWNGLQVSLYSNGTTSIDQNSLKEIKRKWQATNRESEASR
jgi:hypothetical protein